MSKEFGDMPPEKIDAISIKMAKTLITVAGLIVEKEMGDADEHTKAAMCLSGLLASAAFLQKILVGDSTETKAVFMLATEAAYNQCSIVETSGTNSKGSHEQN